MPRATLLVLTIAVVAAAALAGRVAAEETPLLSVEGPKLTLSADVMRQQQLVARGRDALAANATLGSIWSKIKCMICKKAVGKFESFAIKHGCALADGAAAAACEAAGLGPEDPAADACVAAFIAGCEIIVDEVVKHHVTNPATLCSKIHLC